MGRVTINFTGNEAKLIKSLQKVIDKERELGRAAFDAGKKSVEGSAKAKKGIEELGGAAVDKATKKLSQLAIGFVSIQTAVRAATFVVTELTETFRQNQAAIAASVADLSRFQALSAPGAARALLSQNLPGLSAQQRTAIGFTASSLTQLSPEQRGQVLQESQAAGRLGFDPTQVGSAIVGLKGGSLGGRSIPQIGSFLEAGAASSPLTIGQFAQSFPKISGGVGKTAREQAGLSAVLGAAVQSGGGAASKDIATSMLKSFATRKTRFGTKRKDQLGDILTRFGVAGKPIDEQILKLASEFQAGNLKPSEIDKAIGGDFAVPFQTLLTSDLSLIGITPGRIAQQQALERSTSGLQEKQRRQFEQNPGLANVVRGQEALNQREINRTRAGLADASASALLEEQTTAIEKRGRGSQFFGALATGGAGISDAFSFPFRKAGLLPDVTALEMIDQAEEARLSGQSIFTEVRDASRPPALGTPSAGGSGDIR